ncbi:MAG: hypothetical protein ABIR53_04665 [Paraperlucidibaca sp.]
MINTENLSYQAQKAYVTTMMKVVGGGLAAASRVDETVQKELAGLPEGFQVCMTVYPSGPSFFLRIGKNGLSEVINTPVGKPELTIRFKHLTHAFLVFSFQEGTAQAFANDRMVADGNVSHAIRIVRCLNKLEALILPRIIAELAVKRYDAIPLTEKLTKAARIYGLVAKSLIVGN